MAFTNDEIAQIIEICTQHNAHTQYIGARYVPILGRVGEDSIEWNNSKPYEPLTIVLYQGNSYTSRQFVPADIDILNEEFWANTGNYNAQIEQYRQEVQQMSGRIDDEVTARKNADNALGTRIDDEVTARENADNALGTRIDDEVTARENADNALGTRIDDEVTALKPLFDTTKLVNDPGNLSWFGFVNDAFESDAGTRIYIIPRETIKSGTGGAIKIFADNYPSSTNYRDVGLYYSADQKGNKGYNNAGVFWLNTKKEGYTTNADIGFSFDDGLKEIMRFIDAPNTPFVYIGSGTPTPFLTSGIYFKMQVDGNLLVNKPYRIFIGTENSFFANNSGQLVTSASTKYIFNIAGNEVASMQSTGTTFSQNVYFASNAHSIVMKSPDGSNWTLKISNTGVISADKIG